MDIHYMKEPLNAQMETRRSGCEIVPSTPTRPESSPLSPTNHDALAMHLLTDSTPNSGETSPIYDRLESDIEIDSQCILDENIPENETNTTSVGELDNSSQTRTLETTHNSTELDKVDQTCEPLESVSDLLIKNPSIGANVEVLKSETLVDFTVPEEDYTKELQDLMSTVVASRTSTVSQKKGVKFETATESIEMSVVLEASRNSSSVPCTEMKSKCGSPLLKNKRAKSCMVKENLTPNSQQNQSESCNTNEKSSHTFENQKVSKVALHTTELLEIFLNNCGSRLEAVSKASITDRCASGDITMDNVTDLRSFPDGTNRLKKKVYFKPIDADKFIGVDKKDGELILTLSTEKHHFEMESYQGADSLLNGHIVGVAAFKTTTSGVAHYITRDESKAIGLKSLQPTRVHAKVLKDSDPRFFIRFFRGETTRCTLRSIHDTDTFLAYNCDEKNPRFFLKESDSPGKDLANDKELLFNIFPVL